MPRALLAVIYIYLCAGKIIAQSNYMSLAADQVLDENGVPFFPMIMNYYVDDAWTGSAPPGEHPTVAQLANCHLSRSSSYTYQGEFNYSDPAQGEQKIYQDLFEMKLLGFNTIRLIMTPTKQQGTGFTITMKKFFQPGSGQPDAFIRLDPPYDPATNIVANFHFNNVLAVCSLAASLDMKVMLIPADSPNSYPELIRGNVGDAQISDVGDFFTALAAFLHDHGVTNILAYDLLNEPSLAEDHIKSLAGGDYQAMHTKAQVCDLVQYFTDRIRQADPGRLVTVGIYISRDPFRGGWDPMLSAVDFATIHLYPDLTEWEYAIDPAMAMQRAITRYKDQIYIADRTIRKPFMMAETGFSAHDNDGGNHFYFPVSVHGNEADQASFIAQTFPAIRDSRACGYAWWDFEDKHWFSDPYHLPDPTMHSFNSYKEDFFGLHVWCNPAAPDYANGISGYEAYRKDAADLFASWVANPPPVAPPSFGPASPTVDMNELFYNPYQFPENTTVVAGHYGTLTGQVVDEETGMPVQDVIVQGITAVGWTTFPEDPNHQVIVYQGSLTCTDENGHFELRIWDTDQSIGHTVPLPQADKDKTLDDVKIGTYAASQLQFGNWDDSPAQQSTGTYALKNYRGRYDLVTDEAVIGDGEVRVFAGAATATAQDMEIQAGAQVDLKATYEVAMHSEFHAGTGSGFHAFIEPVGIPCSDIANDQFKMAAIPDEESAAKLDHKFITLRVSGPSDGIGVSVRPNPSAGLFTLDLSAGEATIGELQVWNGLGALIGTSVVHAGPNAMDLRGQPTGLYFLSIRLQDGSLFNRKLVLQ